MCIRDRSNIPHLYARSATDKNFRASASSKNPNTTFTEFNHPPDFGILSSQEGNLANNENGIAKATAKPNIPIAGAIMLPDPAACTNNVPMIGPVDVYKRQVDRDTSQQFK